MKPIFLSLVAVCCVAAPAHGGHCVGNFRSYGGYAVKAVFVQPYALVGSAIREEAIAERAAKLAVESYKAELRNEFKALKSDLFKFRGEGRIVFEGEGGSEGGEQPAGNAGDTDYPQGTGVALANNCIQCHGATKKEKGLDLTVGVTDPRIAAEIGLRVVTDDPALRMPPSGQLSDADRQKLFDLSVYLRKSLNVKGDQP